MLRLAKGGLDAAELEFYHQPDHADIAKAKMRLQKLGALREDGSITKIGRDMDRMPVESHYARMMIEARQYGPEVQMQLAAMLAVQEAGGICQFATKNRPCDERWRGLLTPNMNDSDAIKQLEVFVAAERMSDGEKRNHDIYTKAFSKSREVLRQLRGVEKLHDQDLSLPTKEQREQLVKCIIAGMVDNLYISDGYGGHRNAQGDVRKVSSRSVIRPSRMVVGSPFDLQINTQRGLTTLKLLETPTNVPSVDLLREVAPQLFAHKNPQLTIDDGRVVEKFELHFNGQDTGERCTQPAKKSPEATRLLVEAAVNAAWWSAINPVVSQAQALQNRTLEKLDIPTSKMVTEVAFDLAWTLEIDTLDEALQCVPSLALDDIVSPDTQAAILASSPDEWNSFPIAYYSGVPRMANNTPRDVTLTLNPTEMVLSDGREILFCDGTTIARAQESVRQTIEREAARHAENVQHALGMLRIHSTLERATNYYGERAANDALELYQAELAEVANQENRAEERRQEQAAQIKQLLRDNEDVYSRTRLAGIDDDVTPDDIWNEVDEVRASLDDLRRTIMDKHYWLDRGNEVSLDQISAEADQLRLRAQAVTQRFMAWQQSEKEREKQPVSADDLASLAAHFNKR